MILSELKTYMQSRRRASLSDLARDFHADPGAIRGMLDQYIRKGRGRRLNGGVACGGCTQCNPLILEIYEWSGDGEEQAPAPPPCEYKAM